MARRTSSRSRSPREPRQPRATSRKTTVREAEVLEAAPGGSGVEAGIAIMTTILLVIAILCVDAALGRNGSGVFF